MIGKNILKPLKLEINRVRRPFLGGKKLSDWQGLKNKTSENKPEEWIASLITANNEDGIEEGLSYVKNIDQRLTLRDIIKSNPDFFLGKKHFNKYGLDLGILIKIIDSYSRLLIQVHPDKKLAKKFFDSNYGKTEAWYIINTRSINREKPYILLGFKPGITRKKWVELFDKQNINEMEECLHKLFVKAGDVFLVKAGIPHAIGPGCLILEIQEPSDYTLRVEHESPSGNKLTKQQLTQGISFKKMFDCFEYKGITKENLLKKYYKSENNIKVVNKNNYKKFSLISNKDTTLFSMDKLEIYKKYEIKNNDSFSVIVVLNGKGELYWNNESIEINKSDEIFIPAMVNKVIIKNKEENQLNIIISKPPE